MLIVKTSEHVVRAGGKRINLEGLGKNIAARTMSICGPEQILLSKAAYLVFKKRTSSNSKIPKNILIAFVGLYKFKGVKEPELLYALGTEQSHLQPPQSNEKVVRLGGNKKIKTRLRHKKYKELFFYFLYRMFFAMLFYYIYLFWPLLSSEVQKRRWNIDYPILAIFEYINYFIQFFKHKFY